MFLSYSFLIYIIPSIILTVVNIRIIAFLRRRMRVAPGSDPQAARSNASRYKVTYLFVSLIFAFIIPYMVFFFYSGTVMIMKLKLPFTVDYVTRFVSAMLAYGNGAIGATILFYNHTILRHKFISLFRRVFCTNQTITINI